MKHVATKTRVCRKDKFVDNLQVLIDLTPPFNKMELVLGISILPR
jgi:hypothetical protein